MAALDELQTRVFGDELLRRAKASGLGDDVLTVAFAALAVRYALLAAQSDRLRARVLLNVTIDSLLEG